jgi:hypothetical protein
MIRSAIVAVVVAAASLMFAIPAAADDNGYEWGGIASPFVDVCVGIETPIPFFEYIGDCTPDLTENLG